MWWRKQKPNHNAESWQPVGFAEAPLASGFTVSGFAEAMNRVVEAMARPLPLLEIKPEKRASDTLPFPSVGPHGHRDRMRDRLLDRGADGLADYELMEMLLFFAQPKGDTKPVAKRLINQFGSYAAALAAPARELERVQGVGRHSVAALKLVAASAIRLAHAQIKDAPVLGNWDQLMGYLHAVLAHEKIEHFRIIFLDTRNQLLADEEHSRGTVNHTPVYPREVARRALELHAAAVLLVHNHPTGDPTPSMADIEMTMQIERALKALQISLYDHVIIGRGKWLSLKKEGLL